MRLLELELVLVLVLVLLVERMPRNWMRLNEQRLLQVPSRQFANIELPLLLLLLPLLLLLLLLPIAYPHCKRQGRGR